MARPKKPVDRETLEKLMHLQCTQTEIMGFFEIETKDTLNERIRDIYGEYNEAGERNCFSTVYQQKKQGGRIAIRRQQMQAAEKGNTSMLIWLGKQYLGQTDKQAVDHTSKDFSVNLNYKDE